MLTFFLIAAHLSAPVNNKQLFGHLAVSATASEIKAQTPRYFLNVGGADIEVDINLENSALRTQDVLAWVRRATEAVTTYYGRFPVPRARVSVVQNDENDRSIHGTTWGMWTGFKASRECASVEPYRELIWRETGP